MLYACTSTEVLIFRLPGFTQIGYVSLPCFNDLHHVTPSSDGNLLVANTGLDMVVKFTREGEMLKVWSFSNKIPGHAFPKPSTTARLPARSRHQSHPNFVFELDQVPWATRFRQRDAICLASRSELTSPCKPSRWSGPRRSNLFHDGHGCIVIANRHSLKVDQVIDLKEIDNRKSLLGWCRGLLPVDQRRVWVGFSRVRKTAFNENVLWVKNVIREGMGEKPTHIALYDIVDLRCLAEFDVEPYGLNVVFSVLPAFH